MFHFGRSGSTVLTQSLSQLDNVIWHGEIFSGATHMYAGFEDSRFASKKGNGEFQIGEFVDYIADAKNNYLQQIGKQDAIYGCEIKGYHFEGGLFKFSLDQAIQALSDHFDDARFIFLRRKNALRRVVSMEIAKRTNVWHLKTDEPSLNRIDTDFSNIRDTSLGFHGTILEVLKNSEKVEREFSKSIRSFGGLELVYEDDIVGNMFSAIQKICSAFSIEYKDTVVELKKTNPHALEEIVINYEKLEKSLTGSEFEHMLHMD